MPHTQGPWTVHDLWSNNPCIENGGCFEVEEAHYDVKERLEAGSDVERVIKGNARLIAQAPEMYALLKELEWSKRVCMTLEPSGMQYWSDGCPVCDSHVKGDHTLDCRLAAVLKAVEEPNAR